MPCPMSDPLLDPMLDPLSDPLSDPMLDPLLEHRMYKIERIHVEKLKPTIIIYVRVSTQKWT